MPLSTLLPRLRPRFGGRLALLSVLLVVLSCAFVPRHAVAAAAAAAVDTCNSLDCFTATQQAGTRDFLQLLGTALQQPAWTGDDFCAWPGITCAAAGVTVFLGSSGVSGTLPELRAGVDGAQVQVFRLDVSNSPALTGTLPVSWGALTHLAELVLSGTALSGSIPSSYTGMTSLTDFLIFGTKISGTLPTTWSSLASLEHFAAQSTSISGSIPDSWNHAERLEHFFVQETSLSGSLPAAWASLTAMTYFAVQRTAISGTLPEEWGAWSSVLSVRVDETQVSGTLPASWAGMTKIEQFSATNTQLTGTIPDAWGNMTNLKSVTLPNTDVTCCLPYQWVCNTTLTTAGVGLTSKASSSCPTKEVLCSMPESSYTSSCPAATVTKEKESFPWWAILLIVLLALLLLALIVLAVCCCCGCCGCCCAGAARKSVKDEKSCTDAYDSQLRQREAYGEEDVDEQLSRSFVVEPAPSLASVVSVVSAASVVSIRTQPATKVNPFVYEQSTTQSTANAFDGGCDVQCKTASDADVVVPFSDRE